MPSPLPEADEDDDDDGACISHFICHPELGCTVSHYYRQIAISRRRQAPWINQSWCRNRKLILNRTAWNS